jgi:hypothetical protein
MKTLGLTCSIVVVLNCAAIIFFCEHRTPDKQLFSMATSGILLILLAGSLVAGLLRCRREKFHAFVPAAICIIGLLASSLVAPSLGSSIENWRFNNNLPRYVAIAHRIERGEIKTSTSLSRFELPGQDQDLAQITLAKTNNEGAVIEFVTGLGFPLKHSGYLYISTGKIDNETDSLRRWPYHSRINVNWFRVED